MGAFVGTGGLSGGGKSNGIHALFTDEVIRLMEKLGSISTPLLNEVLASVSFGSKLEVKRGIRSKFQERSGSFAKSMQYKKVRNGRYRLGAPNLAAIYEHNGADIFPKDKPFLQWMNPDGSWRRSNMESVAPRPFFYASLRRFSDSGDLNRAMEKAIDEVMRREGIEMD